MSFQIVDSALFVFFSPPHPTPAFSITQVLAAAYFADKFPTTLHPLWIRSAGMDAKSTHHLALQHLKSILLDIWEKI